MFCIKTDLPKNIWNQMKCEVQSLSPLVIADQTWTPEQVAATFRLGFSRTYHSSQGATCRGKVIMFETHHSFFTRRHLLVGMSRGESLESLAFVRRAWLSET